MSPTTSDSEDDESPSTRKRPALTHHCRDQRKSPPLASVTSADVENTSSVLYYWNENDPRDFHPGRYKKLRKLAVLASSVKPHQESRYLNHTGIQILDDWYELVELHALKLQQQQDAKAQKELLKQQHQPAKKKPKPPPPKPQVFLPPKPLTIIPGIQLRTHVQDQNKVKFDERMDFWSPVEVVRHQKFLLQFVHTILEKAQQPLVQYHPPLQQLLPPSPATTKSSRRELEEVHQDGVVDASLSRNEPLPDPVPTTNDSNPATTIDFDNVMHHDSFASRISIHNRVAVSHLVILELHVRTLKDVASLVQSITKAPLPTPTELPSDDDDDDDTSPTFHDTNHHTSNVVVLPTTWYHTNGTEPRSITDRLMYQSDGKHKSTKRHQRLNPANETERNVNTVDFIYEQLKPFVLSYDQWENEKYPYYVPPAQPRVIPNESPFSAVANDRIQDSWDKSPDGRFLRGHEAKNFTMMELNKARLFIQPYVIHTESTVNDRIGNENMSTNGDNTEAAVDDKPCLLPFVSHHHPGLMFDRKNVGSTTLRRQQERILDEYQDTQQDTRRIFAIDCEMVETEMGKELARVTICEIEYFDQVTKTESIDTCKTVLLDAVVQPYNRITNYLTKYSGISADTYDDADNRRFGEDKLDRHGRGQNHILRLEQVQAALLQIIHPCDIVIGHSLENDLHALRFIHPTVVDTAMMFQRHSTKNDNHKSNDTSGHVPPSSPFSSRSFKYSLRHLTAVLLQREIQRPDRPHCSTEDAKAAMDLAVRRAIYGPTFCINHSKGISKNWFTKLSHQPKNPITAVAVGPIQWLRQHVLSPSSSSNAIHALQCESIDDSNSKAIVRWVTGPTRRASVVWSKVELSGSSNNELSRVNDWVQDVITKLSSNNSVVLMIPIQINYSGTKELHQQRQLRRDDPRATMPWSEADEKQYQTSLEACRKGYVLYITAKG